MNFLKREEIKIGSTVPIFNDNGVEGYAILIEPAGEERSFMEAANRDKDGPIFVKQRWLIEWELLENCPPFTNKQDEWTQRSLQGKRTHRHVVYLGEISWDEYSNKHGGLKDKKYYERGDNRALDDGTVLF